MGIEEDEEVKLRRYIVIVLVMVMSMQSIQVSAAELLLDEKDIATSTDSVFGEISDEYQDDVIDNQKEIEDDVQVDNDIDEIMDFEDADITDQDKIYEKEDDIEDGINEYIEEQSNVSDTTNTLPLQNAAKDYSESTSWSFLKLKTSIDSPQKIGEEIEATAEIEGDSAGLQYKFVWQRDDWKEWGVLQPFSDKNTAKWIPDTEGKYELIVDIRDANGECESHKIKYEIKEHIWEYLGIETDKESPQEKYGDPITLRVNTEGDNSHLKYKFIWQRNNWAEWGVLRSFSSETEIVWKPDKVGEYEILVDINDNGNIFTKSIKYSITEIKWDFEGIEISPQEVQRPGESVDIKVNMSGNTKGLQYKFVWQRDNWKEWGVLQSFSENNTYIWIPKTEGKYELIVDILDRDGKCQTQRVNYEIKKHPWKYVGIETDKESPQEKYGDPINVQVETEGDNSHLKYKFVWQRNNWEEWGVLRSFSSKNAATWNPQEIGEYEIIVDILDDNNEIITKSIPYSIIKVQWNFEEIVISPELAQKKGESVDIEVKISGNTQGLKYKFVWQRNNWEEWGVLKSFSENPRVAWKTPDKSGEYQLIVDIMDRDGEIISQSISYWVSTNLWSHEGIDVNQGKPEQIYTNIPITGMASGETEGLEYKFVWKKGGASDGWGQGWGVIRGFSTLNMTEWYPKEAGVYTIYCDIRDREGRTVTKTAEYTVEEAPWKLEKVEFNGTGSYFVGDTMTVKAVTSGETEGLKYKFVCSKGEGWTDWEVVQGFSTNNVITIPIDKATNYYIYIDIMDQRGVVFDAVSAVGKGYEYTSAGASATQIIKGQSVTVYPNLTGPSGVNAQYKFVWMKSGSSDWGVLQYFSGNGKLTWTPSGIGKYVVAIDVNINGIVKTQKIQIVVSNVKNGWYYEGGYKLYYKNGVKQLDLDGILPKQSSYYIRVNRTACTVTVYAKDGNDGYIIPVKRFACSVGLPSTPTPTGTYRTLNKYRWHTLMGPSYGQYCTRIVGGILFHSVAGYNMTSYNLKASDYNKLGSPASHGCVRLCVRDAKWIYDNCSLGTTVNIYDSVNPGPLGKPSTIKIPSWQNWDPTDPNV